MKNIHIVATAVALILMATTASYAGLISEDVTYWYSSANDILSEINPTTEWLNAHMPSLLVKVQQSVFDQASTEAMLRANGDGSHPGYLYAYSVTNLGLGDATDGIINFHVDWATTYYATVSHQTPAGWMVDGASVGGPGWKWTGAGAGIRPGETVGGYWAISINGSDRQCWAKVHLGAFGEPEGFAGKTTGPCPEPATYLSLLGGIAGLGLFRRLRRK